MAGELSLAKARKILGKAADGVSDEQLQKDIDAARLLKTMYFSKAQNKQLVIKGEQSGKT